MKSCFVLVILCFVAMCGLITGSYWVFERVTVSEAAESAARAALQKKLGSIPEQGSLLVVDFSKPSQSKRFRMIDLATGKTGFDARVAHGLNSGEFSQHTFPTRLIRISRHSDYLRWPSALMENTVGH